MSCAVPIVADGDIIGAVVSAMPDSMQSSPTDLFGTDVELRLVQTASAFLARQLQ
ncbi:MAG: hypothetical protein J6B55_02395 [Clostridia bacterium]|nr:hypothetical protein [Clostridia bacterium]